LLASYSENEEGKLVDNLSLIDQSAESVLAPKSVTDKPDNEKSVIETVWNVSDININKDLKTLLQHHIDNYRLSASALQSFVDIRWGGPSAFIEKSLLDFPSAYNAHTALGSSTHSAIEMSYRAFRQEKKVTNQDIIKHLDVELDKSGISNTELQSVKKHAHSFVPKFIEVFRQTDFSNIVDSEKSISTTIKQSGVTINGKLDAIELVDNKIRIIDYKTGDPPVSNNISKQESESKRIGMYFYLRQLYFYKILIEESPLYKYPIESAELVFVESAKDITNSNKDLVRIKINHFDDEVMQHLKKLIYAVNQKIKNADFPDIENYKHSLAGIKEFEADIISSI
jgi:DNA helicase-2/ATP-dependent DNA helicase PcrA